MASRGTSFGKRERDRAKKERQTLKAEKRQERAASDETMEPTGTRSMEDILAEVEALSIQLDEGLIDAEDFADKRAELMAQMKVD